MHYHYRALKAIADFRYPHINKDHSNRIAHSKLWRDEWDESILDWSIRDTSIRDRSIDRSMPVKRKQRSNNQVPDRSPAA